MPSRARALTGAEWAAVAVARAGGRIWIESVR